MPDLFKSIKNIFFGTTKEDDSKYDPPEGEYLPELDGGFDNPLDSMPIANGTNRYAPPERLAELEAEMNPRPEEDAAEWFNDIDTSPSEIQPPGVDEDPPHITMHEKMYRLATARNNPFHVGGSENAQSEIDYIKKHSPWGGGSEKFQGGSERIR
jgi:hypothetical protein